MSSSSPKTAGIHSKTATSNGGITINIERYAGAKQLPLADVKKAAKTPPGIYTEMTREEYDLLPFWNQSLLKTVIPPRFPYDLQWALDHPKQSKAFEFGRAYHYAMLEPIQLPKHVAVWDRKTPAGEPARRAGNEWKNFQQTNKGRIILNEKEHAQILRMAHWFQQDKQAMKVFARGASNECAMVWIDKDTGLVLKGLYDQYVPDEWPTVADIKTTADPFDRFMRYDFAEFGYDVQGATYCTGAKTLVPDKPFPTFLVVASQSTLDTPGYCRVHRIGTPTLRRGLVLMRGALDLIHECIRTDEWPGPPGGITDSNVPDWRLQEVNINPQE